MPSVVTFIAYDIEKRVSKYPEKFGTGVIEGVASPEAANNANCQAGFIPLFALGIPTTPIAAMLLASLMIYGLPVGPMLFKQHGDFAWTVIASMYIGNVMLLILGFILGPLMEQHFRASIQRSGGSLLIFLQRSFCAAFIFLGLPLILMSRKLYSKVSIQEDADVSRPASPGQ